ncbi:uncharacterized protein LOC107267259 isoform X2 [Cephus cinctus]|uniref:Uncharacterized protein LOC107267259 isoform X2 n=1 Tax=Cephus cinctus TaxID=211228 RepID=A0AAJ7RFY5_CEPCN|nr:uncharacterized protein LOC107267259 isoform X2 [Cephus cinctus]
MANTRQSKTVEQLIEQQNLYFDSYRRVWNKCQGSIATTASVRYAQGKKVSLENLWSLFQANHRQIMDNPEPSSPAVHGYIQEVAKSEASSKVDDENEYNDSGDDMQIQWQTQIKVKLPEIKLPQINGELKHWSGFKDLFLALVHHNARLADIERLQYLRGSLKGEAEDFIKRFALSDANYRPAWEQLTARYDNVTVLIDANLKTMFSIPKFKEDKPTNIRELLDVPSQAIEAIRQLGFPLTDLDPVLVFMIKDRMPLETRRLWE